MARRRVAAPATDNSGGRTAGLEWVVRYAVPLVGVIAAALYGVLRLAYVFFYLRLRATPEEVGYGYTEVLASQLIGAIELVLLAALLFFILALAVQGLVNLLRRGRRRAAPRRSDLPVIGEPAWARLALRSGGIAVLVVLVGLPVLAWAEGAEAARGYTVRNVYLLGTVRLPVLAVQAVPATVEWISDEPRQAGDLSSRECLLYLGQTGGTSVFYDVSTQESLRVPSGAIIVSLQNTTSVPIGC